MDDNLQRFFERLGLPLETNQIYSSLVTNGPQTISELTRSSGIERTRIYRLLPLLQQANLIEIDQEYKHGIISAAPLENLSVVIAQKEQEIAYLQEELPLLQMALASKTRAPTGTSMRFYRGTSGVKQMLWNETNATQEIVSVLHQNIQIRTDSKFFERWVEKCNDRKLGFRSVISDAFIESQKRWYQTHFNDKLKQWEGRYINPDKFLITHSTVIYDDVIGHFQWDDKEIFGIEIHNARLAQTQRQYFELLWDTSLPINGKDSQK